MLEINLQKAFALLTFPTRELWQVYKDSMMFNIACLENQI